MAAPPDLRWKLADDDAQGALFEEELGRRAGEGEFRGMEFIHVRARSIINEVPKSSPVPFRYTINAYRGCSHACSYCLAGSTEVLMGDGTTKAIAELAVGDEVFGTTRIGCYRRFVRTPILDHWSTVKPAYRVALADGTELIASGDHRFLSDRGWKFVVGSEHGRLRRLHLTVNNRLLGTGRFAPPPEGGSEYRRGYLCGTIRNDGHLGHYDDPRPGRSSGAVHRFRLALVDVELLRRVRRYLGELDVTTHEFAFQAATGTHRAIGAIPTQSFSGVAGVEAAIAWPACATAEWAKGFLAGVFDAEGSYSRGILRIANTSRAIIRRLSDALDLLGFRYTTEATARGMHYVRLLGGLREHLRFFHTVDPAIRRKTNIEGRALTTRSALNVVAVEPLGVEMPLFDVTTGTGDFIANGVVSHNCFARPTHEYLGMNSGDDFDRRIVVKVNAVPRLRAELAPARWGGHHIAMGTNTDPYQRCEGKYRLTRGIIRELAAAANPFSILTKSTLILRDLDLLAGAAARTEVAANFSIGTVDEEVWRATEPGTPHPMRRVEAVARLNRAGVSCGVLIAPVLPGLSDRPEQLEAVVKACVEAGARSISPILLHLRPGVREHYLSWLEGARPDLVDRYRKLYPRAYAPSSHQEELATLVRELLARHGVTATRPREARAISRPRPPTPAPGARREDSQLTLGL